MAGAIVVLNAGSSSLKFSAFVERAGTPELLFGGQFAALSTHPRFVVHDAAGQVLAERDWGAGATLSHDDAIESLFTWGRGALGEHHVAAAGHRVVHGGLQFTGPVRVDARTLAALHRLVPLAPLHQPHNVAAIEAVLRRRPDLPQVACFDTSFHRTQPEVAQRFALPRRLHDEGVRRYGFHGLSYEYIASELPRLDPRAARGRTVVAHLGNGASLCALEHGRSVATTMGFTALDGLVMSDRCGALDPGVLLFLMDHRGLDARALEDLLYRQSGLLGVSGLTGDMRALLASADPNAAEAVELFVYRLGRELGSLAAALGGLDALVFTGGIGENSPAIRARVAHAAAWLGVELDADANAAGRARLDAPGSRVAVWRIPTNEELVIARHVQQLLAPAPRA